MNPPKGMGYQRGFRHRNKESFFLLKIIAIFFERNNESMETSQTDGVWRKMRCVNRMYRRIEAYVGYHPNLEHGHSGVLRLTSVEYADHVKWLTVDGDIFLQRDDNKFLGLFADTQIAAWSANGSALLYNGDYTISLKSNPNWKLSPDVSFDQKYLNFYSVEEDGVDPLLAFQCYFDKG